MKNIDLSKYEKKYNAMGSLFRKVLSSDIDYGYAGWEWELKNVFGFNNEKAARTWVKNNMPDFYDEFCYNESAEVKEIKYIIDKQLKISIFRKNWNIDVFNVLSDMAENINTQVDACLWVKRNMPEFFQLNDKTDPISLNVVRQQMVDKLSDDFVRKNKNIEGIISEITNIPYNEVRTWLDENVPDFYTRAFIQQNNTSENISNKVNQEEVSFLATKEEIVKNSKIDFKKPLWERKLSKQFGLSDAETHEWVKRNMPDFYNNECYNERTVTDAKKRYILNCKTVNFNKRNWHIELSRLFEEIPKQTYFFVKENMPEFFKNCYTDPRFGKENSLISVANYLQIIFEADINFSEYGWDKKVAELLNIPVDQARAFIKKKLNVAYDERFLANDKELNNSKENAKTPSEENISNNMSKDISTKNSNEESNDNTTNIIPNKKVPSKEISNSKISNNRESSNKEISNKVDKNSISIRELNKLHIEECNEVATSNPTLFHKRKNLIMNCDIDFSKYGWMEKLNELFGVEGHSTSARWLTMNMPIFYKKYCNTYNSRYPNKNKYLIQKRKAIIENSNINFSQKGWAEELGKLFGISSNSAYIWVKANMPEFYREKCGNTRVFTEDVFEKRKIIIETCNIDFAKRGWSVKLANLFGTTPVAASIWIKNNMPDFYNKNCYRNGFKENSENIISEENISAPVEKIPSDKRKDVIKNSNIDFSKRGWSVKVANLLNISSTAASAWVRNNMPEVVKKEAQ